MKLSSKTRINCFFLIIIITMFVSCGRKKEDSLAARLKDLEKDVSSVALADESIRDLEKKIADLEKPIDMAIKNEMDKGYYYKIIGLKYMDYAMYGKALEYLQKALEIYPDNQNILYKTGICAAQFAQTGLKKSERMEYLYMANSSYRRALDIRPEFPRALYAYSVLLIFELEAEAAAEPFLDRLILLKPEHTGALFLKARLLAGRGFYEDAIELYDKIQDLDPGSEQALNASENKNSLLEVLSRG